jgi:hypothetical protein
MAGGLTGYIVTYDLRDSLNRRRRRRRRRRNEGEEDKLNSRFQ